VAQGVNSKVDATAAGIVGAALRRVAYDERAIERLLGEDAWSTAVEDAESHERRLPQTDVAAAIRLFFLERSVARRDAERALGAPAVNALGHTKLARIDKDTVEPLTRIAPVGTIMLASDRLSTDATSDPPDYVSTYSPTARLCDLLTPRPWVARALDVGTGNGVQALLAAGHSEHVVATDVNPRALAFTELNAALSGIDNVETRRGSLFEPVAGERFDLIVCNPPFVVSPERRWTYRDGWLEGDELSAQVVRETAEHLADGGFATILASWLGRDSDAPDDHAWDWVQGIGCDAWILPVDEASPREHAERWNAHLADDDTAYRDAVTRWVAYLNDLGAGVVTEGGILLHRRDGTNTTRIDEVDEDELDPADHQIRRAFAARAALNGSDLLDAPLEPVDTLRVKTRSGRARVTLEEGIWSQLDVPLGVASVLRKLDGRPLRELKPSDAAVAACRELLELGAFELPATSAP
jgi:methylase of polypeptide subunit release factors